MGSALSLHNSHAQHEQNPETFQTESSKRLRMSLSCNFEDQILIPGLPDDISLEIIARLPRSCYLKLKMVSRQWKAAIMSPDVYKLRTSLGRTEEWLYILTKLEETKFFLYSLDPLSGEWQRLPPIPNTVYEEPLKGFSYRKAGNAISRWLGKNDDLDLHCSGCVIEVLNGCLYALGGFSKSRALKCVWQYNPRTNSWKEVCSMNTGRAFCKTSVLNNKLYVVGGLTRRGGALTPLQSAEVYDPCTGLWAELPSMPISNILVMPTAFLADLLKPIATSMTCYRGRLCVPQSLYSWPFFVEVGGAIFDPVTESWEEMPSGMGEGWPAKQATAQLSAVVNGKLYAFEPSCSLDNGRFKIYDDEEDAWKVVSGRVPLSDLTDSEVPYMLTSFRGKLHIIKKDVNNDVSVLEANMTCIRSFPTNSSCCAANLTTPSPDMTEKESDFWKIIASKKIGTSELISCQVLCV